MNSANKTISFWVTLLVSPEGLSRMWNLWHRKQERWNILPSSSQRELREKPQPWGRWTCCLVWTTKESCTSTTPSRRRTLWSSSLRCISVWTLTEGQTPSSGTAISWRGRRRRDQALTWCTHTHTLKHDAHTHTQTWCTHTHSNTSSNNVHRVSSNIACPVLKRKSFFLDEYLKLQRGVTGEVHQEVLCDGVWCRFSGVLMTHDSLSHFLFLLQYYRT